MGSDEVTKPGVVNPLLARPSSRVFLDLDDNGIPDYREPWFWRAAWGVFSGLVRAFAGQHTRIFKAVDAIDPHVRGNR